VQLLLIIRGYCCSFDANQQGTFALEGAKHRVQVFIQGHDVTVTDYVEYFMALVGVVETYGGAYGNKPGLLREQLIKQGVSAADVDKTIANGGPDETEIKKALVVTRECYLSCMILRGSDNSRFYQVKTDLQNDMTKGTDNFPKTVVETTRLLSDYKVPPRHVRAREPDSEGVAFMQGGGKKTPAIETIECYHCGKKGHYKSSCPELQIEEVQNLNVEDCVEGHGLFSTDEEFEMLQKEDTSKAAVRQHESIQGERGGHPGKERYNLIKRIVPVISPFVTGHSRRDTGLRRSLPRVQRTFRYLLRHRRQKGLREDESGAEGWQVEADMLVPKLE
jgi:hypothetical protein